MDLNTLRSELRKLSALADGWDAPEKITTLERDLALEKLREIYDLVRFPEQTPEPQPQAELETSMSIDLDDVLSLGLIPDVEEESETDEASADAVLPSEEPALSAEPELSSEPTPAAIPEPFTEAGVEVDEPVAAVEHAVEPIAIAEPAFEPVFVAEPTTGPDTESIPESDANPFLELTAVPEPEPEVQPVPAPKPVLGSLFGMDDEDQAARHRRKQRVIMSLYGNDTPVSKPAFDDPESDDVFEEFSVETLNPAGKPEPAGNIAPDDETFGGEEPAPEATAELDDPDPEAPAESENSAQTANPESSVVGAILGEVINQEVHTLADTYATHPGTLSEAHRAPVGNLRTVIGLNDRFLLIRDLFDGDAAACDAALDAFDSFDNLDDCMIHIAENYNWNPDCDGARFLMDLLERKYA